MIVKAETMTLLRRYRAIYFSRNFENYADKALAGICKTLQITVFILNRLCRLYKFKEQKYKLQIFIASKNRISGAV